MKRLLAQKSSRLWFLLQPPSSRRSGRVLQVSLAKVSLVPRNRVDLLPRLVIKARSTPLLPSSKPSSALPSPSRRTSLRSGLSATRSSSPRCVYRLLPCPRSALTEVLRSFADLGADGRQAEARHERWKCALSRNAGVPQHRPRHRAPGSVFLPLVMSDVSREAELCFVQVTV